MFYRTYIVHLLLTISLVQYWLFGRQQLVVSHLNKSLMSQLGVDDDWHNIFTEFLSQMQSIEPGRQFEQYISS